MRRVTQQGARNHNSKVTDADVIAMRRAYDERGQTGVRLSDLAARFGLAVSTVHLIVSRKGWRHLP